MIGPLPLNFNSVHRVLLPGLCSVRFTSLLSARTSQLQGSVEGSDSSQVGSCWLVRPPFAVTTRRKCIILRLRGTVTSFLHRNGRIIQVKCWGSRRRQVISPRLGASALVTWVMSCRAPSLTVHLLPSVTWPWTVGAEVNVSLPRYSFYPIQVNPVDLGYDSLDVLIYSCGNSICIMLCGNSG